MKFASVPARCLGALAFCFLPSWAGAQTLPLASAPPQELAAQQPSGQPLSPDQLTATPQRFERAWDVVELMGQPMLSDAQRPARILIRPQGSLLVDGGCNYFSGRIERDAQGLFRISRYGGTHGGCEKPPRSEAFLNSALVMVDNYRWDRGLVLRSGANDLVRLQPSANQDSQDIEQALASRAATSASSAAAPLSQAAEQNCRKVKVAQSRKAKGRHAKAAATRLVCKPVASRAAHQGASPARKSKATKTLAKGKAATLNKARGKGKAAGKAKPAANHGQHKTSAHGHHKR